MLKSISVVVLVLIALTSVPLEAQIFRRLAPAVQQRANSPQPTYQQQYVQRPVVQQRQPTLNQYALQANRTTQVQRQSPANCACNQNRQPTQVRAYAQSPVTSRSVVRTNPVSPTVTRQPQRYNVYYDARTNRSYLRPVQAVARTVQNSNLTPVVRRQPQPTVASTQQYAPQPNSNINQYDIARQNATRNVAPVVASNPPLLNAPISSSATAPPSTQVPMVQSTQPVARNAAPALNAPVGTLTVQPAEPVEVTTSAVAPAKLAEPEVAAPAEKSFSVLNTKTPEAAPVQPATEVKKESAVDAVPPTSVEKEPVTPTLAEPETASPTEAEPKSEDASEELFLEEPGSIEPATDSEVGEISELEFEPGK